MAVKTTIDDRGVVQEQGDGSFTINVPIQANQNLTSNTVSNIAALCNLPTANIDNGTKYRVQTVGDYFELQKSSAATTSYLSALTASGGGRWLRAGIPDTKWLYQASWYIDPISGSDENVGDVATGSLQTWNELYMRWGNGRMLQNPTTTIFLLNSSPPEDPIILNCALPMSGQIVLSGTMTLIRTGTFTGITNLTRSTNTPVTGSDSNMTTGWVANQFQLCTISGGSRGGAAAWVAKDINTTTARFSPFQSSSIGSSQRVTLTLVNPSAGDNYSIYELPSASLGAVDIQSLVHFTPAAQANIRFDSINIVSKNNANVILLVKSPRTGFVLHRCRVRHIIIPNNDATNTFTYSNCQTFGSVNAGAGGTTNLQGGLICSGATANAGATLSISNDASIEYPGTGSLTGPISVFAGGTLSLNNVGFFNWPSTTAVMNVTAGSTFNINGPIYGTGNSGPVLIQASCRGTIATTVTAFSGTITLNTGSGNEVRFGQASSTATFLVSSGTAVSTLGQVWHNFDIDQPAGFRIPGTTRFSVINAPMGINISSPQIN